MRWVDLIDDLPRLDVILARYGTSSDCLIIDICDVLELAEICARLHGNPDALLRLALEEFGDKGRSQPTERRLLSYSWELQRPIYTPYFGQLPPIGEAVVEGADHTVVVSDLKERRALGRPTGRVPIPQETFWAVLHLAVDGVTARGITQTTDERGDLAFVNRIKAGELIKWVKDHPQAALPD